MSLWRATKLILVLIICLVPLAFCAYHAFTGLFLGFSYRPSLTMRSPYSTADETAYGSAARICGLVWLGFALFMAVILVRQFRKGLKEGESGSQ